MESQLYRYNPWWEGDSTVFDELHKRQDVFEQLIPQIGNKQIVFLTGLRRVGKSSLLKLCVEHLIQSQDVNSKHMLYVSLDDFLLKDFTILDIVETFRKMQQLSHQTQIYLFLDEITYARDYDIQLKNLYDMGKVKVFASSSSASLMHQQSALLTGRNIRFEILPLDFQGYLNFKKINISLADPHLQEAHFKDFLLTGGLPEYVLTGDDAYIRELTDNIIYKDIAAVNGIRQLNQLKDYFLMLMERSGKTMSINKVAKVLGISTETSKRYFDMFSGTYMIYPVVRHGKLNEQMVSPKKIYCCDLGVRSYYTGARDWGALFENYVFLRLKHLNLRYVYENTNEIDFYTDNKWLIECKFHNDELSAKQQKLFNEYPAKERIIIRNEADLQKVLERKPV